MFFDFTFVGPNEKWYRHLDILAELALFENWNFKIQSSEAKNPNTPILENYIIHTFNRLAFEYNNCDEREDKNSIIYISQDDCKACFNTGLFTKQYEPIYAIMRKNRTPNKEEWNLIGFKDASDFFFRDITILPRRANYFNKMDELIFDTRMELRVNSAHILSDEDNIKRLPPSLANKPSTIILFNGAIDLAKKKVQANYKAAVPQCYGNQLCFLLPICLLDPEVADLSLAVKWHNDHYQGHTCLTLDMAYNNARLIASPNSEWLKP